MAKMPGSDVCFVGSEKKNYTDQYGLKLSADQSIDEISQADVLLVPGGFGVDDLLENSEVINWIRRMDESTKWTVSVCSGSLLLAQAGLLGGKNCTTHWRRKDQLRQFNVNVVDERYVQDGKYITSAGVSAGIDMALYLVSKIAGEPAAKMIQLSIEYDPQPPFNCGSPEKVPESCLKSVSDPNPIRWG